MTDPNPTRSLDNLIAETMAAEPDFAAAYRRQIPTTYPDFYDSDTDEMTGGQLAVLLEARLRLRDFPAAVEIVDAFAAEVLALATDEEDEDDHDG